MTSSQVDSKGRSFTIEEMPISLLDWWNSPTQILGRYDAGTAEDYASRMRDGRWDWSRTDSFPVLFREVAEDGEIALWIGDGHHTLEGAEKAEIGTIKFRVYEGTLIDAKIYSFREANQYHGIRLSNAQKREIVAETLRDRSILDRICESAGGKPNDVPSERLIAEYFGGSISAPTIGDVWEELIREGEELPWLLSNKRLGKNGTRRGEKKSPAPSIEVEKVAPIDDIETPEAIATEHENDNHDRVEVLPEKQQDNERDEDSRETVESIVGPEQKEEAFYKDWGFSHLNPIARKHSEDIVAAIERRCELENPGQLRRNLHTAILETLTEYKVQLLSQFD